MLRSLAIAAQHFKRHWGWLRWLLALGIMGLLFFRYRDQFRELIERQIDYRYLFLAFLLCGGSIALTCYRWHLLVWALGFTFRFANAIRLGFIGYLCNYIAPGAAGGDLVKAVMIAREYPDRKTVVVATILLDRILGLLALFLVGSLAATLQPKLLELREVQMIVTLLVAGSVAGLLGLFVMMQPWFPESWLLKRLQRLPVVGTMVEQLAQGIQQYQQRPRYILAALAISFVGHLGMLSSFYFCAQALRPGDAAPGYWAHLMLVPGAELASVVIPLPGGVGALEGAIMYVYRLANLAGNGSASATEVEAMGLFAASAYRLISVMVALLGAGYYLTARRDIGQLLVQQAQPEAEADDDQRAAPTLDRLDDADHHDPS